LQAHFHFYKYGDIASFNGNDQDSHWLIWEGSLDYGHAVRMRVNYNEFDAHTVKYRRFDGDGLMTRGVIVRHLVLPGHTDDSKRILGYLHREYGDSIYISIMNQYTPMPGMEGELARPLTEEEYAEVTDYARAIGIRQAFLQEGGTVSESFIPAFDGEGVLPC